MVHTCVESEGALFVSRSDFYETLRHLDRSQPQIAMFLKQILICALLGSAAQLRTICDALIPHMAIFGVRLLFLKKSFQC